MGNCIDVQKPVLWADDGGWESSSSEEEEHESHVQYCRGKRRVESTETAGAPVAAAGEKGTDGVDLMGGSAATEIKLKISKKKLQELLRQVEEKGLPLDELLADLVAIGHQICFQSSKRADDHHWRPNLQSIPEISE